MSTSKDERIIERVRSGDIMEGCIHSSLTTGLLDGLDPTQGAGKVTSCPDCGHVCTINEWVGLNGCGIAQILDEDGSFSLWMFDSIHNKWEFERSSDDTTAAQ
jgi:hypothetical protein